MREPECFGLFDLPKYVVCAVVLPRDGFVEGINSRQTIFELVNNRDHLELRRGTAVTCFVKFDHERVDPGVHKKLDVLCDIVMVHATARVSGFLIPLVQRVMLV